MAAPGISTYDATPPHRPGSTDLNGISLQDRADAPPNPATMPTAALLNTEAFLAVSYGAVVVNAKVAIKYVSGSPTIDSQAQVTGVSPGSSTPSYTLIRTVGGAGSGDVFLYWPANTFPPQTVRPKAGLNGLTVGMIATDWYTDGSGNSGVRIVTTNTAGTATDLPFTVEIP